MDDLQKASESANHENSILRAQIEKMSMELKEYRKRIPLTGGLGRTPSFNGGLPPYLAGKGLSTTGINKPSDVNFQFEFPRFGRLPGPAPVANGTSLNGTTANDSRNSSSPSLTTQQTPSSVEIAQSSPRNQSMQSFGMNGSNAGLTQTPTHMGGGDMSSLSGLFSPTLLDSVARSPTFDFFGKGSSNTNGSRSSTDSANGTGSTGHNTSYSSPSASSNSNHGASSSCGTSPEPTMQSPNMGKAADPTLTTIGEEHSGEGELTFCDKLNMACGNPNNPVPRTISMSETGVNPANFDPPLFDINGIDWFAQQNGNQFDPQLFGDYREPQDNILAGETFTDNFFSDAFALPEFNSPFNMAPSPAPPKKDLVQQIDEKQNEDDEVVPAEDRSKLLNCNTIWLVTTQSWLENS